MTPPTAQPPRSRSTARAWAELPVRPWLVMTLCLLLAAITLAAARLGACLHERRVIGTGTPVEATVVSIGLSNAREGSREDIQSVVLRYTPPGASTPVDASGELPRKPGSMLSIKDVVNVRIDPQQPTYWTERDTPQPVSQVLVTPFLCLMIGLLSGFVAWLRRAGVVRAFDHGLRVTGTVVGVRQSPLAPLSKQVSVVVPGDDRRVLHCYWPGKLGPIATGRQINLIVHPPLAIVADLYPG